MSSSSANCSAESECDDKLNSDNAKYQPVLTMETMNPNLRAVQPKENSSTPVFMKIVQIERDLREVWIVYTF
jgi:hypothetical protein